MSTSENSEWRNDLMLLRELSQSYRQEYYNIPILTMTVVFINEVLMKLKSFNMFCIFCICCTSHRSDVAPTVWWLSLWLCRYLPDEDEDHFEAYSSFKSDTLDCSRVLFCLGRCGNTRRTHRKSTTLKKPESRRYFWVLVRISWSENSERSCSSTTGFTTR